MDIHTTNSQDTNNPPRNVGIPLNPVPQTNTGLMEHVAIPSDPMVSITDIPPDFDWMVRQWKLKKILSVDNTQDVGAIIGYIDVLALGEKSSDHNGPLYQKTPSWIKLPFSVSKWWKGTVSHRFTIIKPPRVTGKLLIRWRQDTFGTSKGWNKQTVKDATMRSILKEWDLSETNQFEFDITASLPIQARPTKFQTRQGTPKEPNIFVSQVEPYINVTMGSFTVEIAQKISPGGIFPDTFSIIVERAFKDASFMTPTDSKSTYVMVIDRPLWKPTPS